MQRSTLNAQRSTSNQGRWRRALLLGPAVLLAIQPLPLLAQPAPATTQPAAADEPATQPAGGTATVFRPPTTARPATTQISFNFREAPLDVVLEHLSELAGFVVVKDASVSIDTRVTVLSKQPVSPEEAVTLLNTVLKTSGATAVQMGRTLKIMSRETA